jgi:hypothetical protein
MIRGPADVFRRHDISGWGIAKAKGCSRAGITQAEFDAIKAKAVA